MLTPIQLPNISDVIYAVLRERIFKGGFTAGEQLNLLKLEQQLDVSRTPLKAALARLQAEGLVTIHPRRGTYITAFTPRDLEECFEMRIALEAQALTHVYQPHNRERLQVILDLLDETTAYFETEAVYLEQIPRFMDIDHELHLNIMHLSGNQRMIDAYERANVMGYIGIMGAKFHYADVLKTRAEHHAIADALRENDLAAVLAAARAHLENACVRAVQRTAAQVSTADGSQDSRRKANSQRKDGSRS